MTFKIRLDTFYRKRIQFRVESIDEQNARPSEYEDRLLEISNYFEELIETIEATHCMKLAPKSFTHINEIFPNGSQPSLIKRGAPLYISMALL